MNLPDLVLPTKAYLVKVLSFSLPQFLLLQMANLPTLQGYCECQIQQNVWK